MLGNLLRPRVALALGGGGARGLAHLGVLRVLERERIPVDLVLGSSMGAVVAALWSFGGGADEAQKRLFGFIVSPSFRGGDLQRLATASGARSMEEGILTGVRRAWTLALFFATNAFRSAYFDPEHFSRGISKLLPDARVEDAPRPLVIVATDLASGEEFVITRGPVRKAVQASSALAGVFLPVNWDGRPLVDGGYSDLVPVEPAFRLGADAVIAVDVSDASSEGDEFALSGNALQIRAASVLAEIHKRLLLRFADAVVRPAVSGIHWADFGEIERIVRCGEEAAQVGLPAIRAALSRGTRQRLLGLVKRRRWHVDLRSLRAR